MRKSHLIIGIFIFAIGILHMAGAPLSNAQDLKVTGSVAVGFGRVNLESTDPETTGPDGVGEAVLNFAAKKGAFSAQIELEVDDATQLEVAEHEIVWAVKDSLSITISGQSFGIESAADNTSVINAPAGQVGDEEEELDFGDAGLLNVELTLGGMILGIAFLDTCVPECGTDGTLFADSGRMTTVLHLRGGTDAMTYNLYASTSRGSFTSTGLIDGEGSGGGLGLFFKTGDFGFGLDASTATVNCQPLLAGCITEDVETTNFGLTTTFGGFGIHYFSGEETVGSSTTEVTNIDVVYTFAVGDATVGPEYRLKTTDETGKPSVTDSFLVFGMSMEF